MKSKLNIKNIFKNNYQLIFSFIILFVILLVSINPTPYINATLKGISIWADIVLPSLFCFFIFTTLLMNFGSTPKIFDFLNKPFEKLYNTKKVGGYIFAMSFFAGYPVGAKLISEFYNNKTITINEAHRLISYCSTSGPMFILGSLASTLFNNFNLGIVIMLSHFISALLNGLIYRKFEIKPELLKEKVFTQTTQEIKKESLNDIMHNTIISSLMVGGYIALCFTLLEIIFNLGVLTPLSTLLENVFNLDGAIFQSIFKGIIEVTNGCVSLSSINISLKTISIILTGLLSFGGLSIHLQTNMFLSKCNVKYKFFLLTKITHTILAVILSIVFSQILL